ncbi:hypothetical protein RCH07_003930, partial [Arthrobacter sp. CG_A4]|nr:hypothetical protein [Arthrobacter sp. CG_A4]
RHAGEVPLPNKPCVKSDKKSDPKKSPTRYTSSQHPPDAHAGGWVEAQVFP